MTAQQLHDLQLKGGVKVKPNSRKVLAGMLTQKKNKSSTQSQPLDAIEWAMQRHSGLTREKAEEMAEYFGF